jgi:hypothetical protein
MDYNYWRGKCFNRPLVENLYNFNQFMSSTDNHILFKDMDMGALYAEAIKKDLKDYHG